jgi:GPH family glycoside/pentoside/hexuronide:cation symporter
LQGLFLLLYFLSGALFMPFWTWGAARVGKYQSWMGAMILSIVTFGFAYTLQFGDVVTYGIICVLSGIALGGDLSLPPSILADRVSKKKNEAQATQYYAALAFLPKIAIAIASGGTFLILNHYGFTAGAEKSEDTQNAMIVMYALVPCFIKLVAVGLLWRLDDFKGEKDEKINERINAHERSGVS